MGVGPEGGRQNGGGGAVKLAPRIEIASAVLANVAYAALCVAALAVLFPGLRVQLQQLGQLALYRVQLAAYQAGRAPAPAWIAELGRSDLPGEDVG